MVCSRGELRVWSSVGMAVCGFDGFGSLLVMALRRCVFGLWDRDYVWDRQFVLLFCVNMLIVVVVGLRV